MKKKPKILLIANKGYTTNIMFNYLSDHFQLNNVILEDSISPFIIVKNRIKRIGLFKVIGQILFHFTIVPILKIEAQNRVTEIISDNNLILEPIPEKFISRTTSINSKHAIDLIKSCDPEIIIVSGCRIISKKVLKDINAEFINIHAGITPEYRGVHGGYWALRSGNDQDFGVTLHKIDSGIDTGEVISQHRMIATKQDNFVSYPFIQLSAGLLLLNNYLNTYDQNYVQSENMKSRLWYHPTFRGYLFHRLTKGIK